MIRNGLLIIPNVIKTIIMYKNDGYLINTHNYKSEKQRKTNF